MACTASSAKIATGESVAYEKKKMNLPAIAGGMAAAVASMMIGSLFGTKGTILGAALGSVVYAVIATVIENALGRTHQLITEAPNGVQKTVRYARAGGIMAGACLLAAFLTAFTIEKATGKTLHSDLTGKAQYGNSFSFSTRSPSPAPRVTETDVPVVTPSTIIATTPSPSATVTVTATPTPTVTITQSPSGPPVTVTPTGTATQPLAQPTDTTAVP